MKTAETLAHNYPPSQVGEPTWELAERLYPRQGEWTMEEFLALENRGIKYVDGCLEFPGANTYLRNSKPGEPTWELAERGYPRQGDWTESEYFALELRGVELVDRRLEFLPVPTIRHQDIMLFLYRVLFALLNAGQSGKVSVSGANLLIGAKGYLEPDIVVALGDQAKRISADKFEFADLVMEIVSPGEYNRRRDYEHKRADYAAAGIAEYWIVDPQRNLITVLALNEDKTYRTHGEFKQGERASSVLLKDFHVDVTETLAGGLS